MFLNVSIEMNIDKNIHERIKRYRITGKSIAILNKDRYFMY